MLLVYAWARSKPALMFSWRLHVNGPSFAPNTGYSSPCNTCTVTPGFWVMNVPVMPLHWVHLAPFPATTMPLAGFVITLTHLTVVMVVTASARFWKDCIALEQKQRRYLQMGVSAVFTIGFFVSLTYAFVSSVILLSGFFFPRIHFALQESQWKAQLRLFLRRRASIEFSRTTCGILSWNCSFTSRRAAYLFFTSKKTTWSELHSCHFALDLLCYKESAYDSV